jgi:hypothetical protein
VVTWVQGPDEPARSVVDPGGRFAAPADAPALSWIMVHVLQEYARHVGHLDIVREPLDGVVGE